MRDALRLLWALMVIATLTMLYAVLGGTVSSCSGPMPLYGPPRVDDGGGSTDGCTPKALYGPQGCASNDDCVARKGAGWYCRTVDLGSDGCGGELSWPVCVQGTASLDAGAPAPDASCEPSVLYGPRACASDDDCAGWYGPGSRCDKESVVNDGCLLVAWPTCTQDVDAGSPARDAACGPIALYGPRPCLAGECDGGVCDEGNTFIDGCGNSHTWPICK